MKDELSIKQFAEIANVDTSKLRFWDKAKVFSPIKRSGKANYRRYTLTQLIALNFVTALSSLQISLEKIAELRNERNPEGLLQLLSELEKNMDMEMRNLRLRYSMIHARRELITMGMKANEDEISVALLDDRPMILWPRNEYKEGEDFLAPLSHLITSTHDLRIDLNFPVAGLYDDMDSFKRSPQCPDHFLSIDPVGTYMRKAGKYLVGYTRGYYGEAGDLPERMNAYAKKNKLTLTGPVYLIYLIEETCTNDTSQYLAECSVEVK